MNLIVLDFETFFSGSFTLKKLTTEAYIRDAQFEPLLLGVYEPSTKFRMWLGQEDIRAFLKTQDWSQTAVLAHHAHFDGLILSHHYGVEPAMWFDTLSMARLIHGNATVGGSLTKLAEHYKLLEKSVPYQAFKGRRWMNIPHELRQQLGEACLHDCELTWEIFKRLGVNFPREEYDVVDATVRMFTEPKLIGDKALFEQLKMQEWTSKQDRLRELNVSEADLQSANKFAKLLEAEGVDVEMKEGKNGPIPAIAATDAFMRDLCEDANPHVSALAQARLEVRSTIDETRAGRLASMASRGPMPVYLTYCGAQTLRWSGGDKVNFQNMRRSSELRKGLSAPEGYLLAIIDLSQIEARLLAYLSGQDDLVETFRQGDDPYVGVASEVYGKTVTKADKAERGLGKLLVLSCGYGSGAQTIVQTAAKGTYGPPLTLTEQQGFAARDIYRRRNFKIVAYWKQCDEILKHLSHSEGGQVRWGPMIVGPGYIEMPNGARMLYELQWDVFREGERSYYRKTRNGWRRIWGGVLAQNICEAFGRLLVSQAIVRMRTHGFRTVLTTHDEVVVLVPDNMYSHGNLERLVSELTRVPDYLPGLPLAAEGHLSKSYDK